jgi:molecular chaperone IbpA
VLSVQGKRDPEPDETQYLYQGIAGRSFERRFQLEENVEVHGARVESGLLHVDLERIVPEEKKPRRIAIVNADWKADAKVIDTKQKAA